MMDQTKMAKQMIDLQRVTFNGMINNMLILWDQTEKMLNVMMDQSNLIPEEGKRAFREWVDTNKKGCENFRNAVDDGFGKMQSCFMGDKPHSTM